MNDVRRGVAWSLLTFGGGRVVTFVATLILARLLTPADFGVVAAILVWLSLLELGSDLGVGAAVVYEQERGITERVRQAARLNVIVATGLCALAVLASPLLAASLGFTEHTGLFAFGALSLLFTGLGNVNDAVLRRDLAFRRRAAPALAKTATRGIVSIAMAVSGFGAVALVAGMVAGSLVGTLVLWWLAPVRPARRLDRGIARSLAAFGLPAAGLQVLSVLTTRLDVLLIGRVLGESALGLYSLAFRLPELLVESVAWQVSQVAFPALSRARLRDGSPATQTLALVRAQALYVLPVAAGLAVLSTPVVLLAFGEQWREAAPVTGAVAVMVGINASVFPLGDGLKSLGRRRTLINLGLLDLAVLIPLMVLTAPAGIVAVAWARVGLSVFHATALAWLAARAIGIRWSSLGRALIPGLGVALAAVTLALIPAAA